MDPLTITTSIFGLLKATAQVANYLGPYVSAARDTPKIVAQVHSEVTHSRTILLALEGLTKNLASVPVRRAAIISIDELIAVFTDGVLLFSELEASLPSVTSTEPTSSRLPLQARLQWARKESAFAAFLVRLQGFKGSISLMLTILRSDSDLRAAEHQQELSANVAALLESNQSLSRRLMNLEDAFEVRTIVSKRQSLAYSTTNGINDDSPKVQHPSELTEGSAINKTDRIADLSAHREGNVVSTFEFQSDLEASRVYRRAQRDTMDFSFCSSIAHTSAWSIFSGFSLSDVSIISAIALPLYQEDISNAQHYGFGERQPMQTTASTTTPRERSLYEECLEVELRLSRIPGFPEIFAAQREGSEEEDPLTFLIQIFRRGTPLLMLLEKFPGLGNPTHLVEDDMGSQKLPKKATYIFLEACIKNLSFRVDECFSIRELMEGDTTGFAKVVRTIDRVLEMLTRNGNIDPIDLVTLRAEREQRLTTSSHRDIIVEEFLVDERSYVANLERLHELKSKIETYGIPNKIPNFLHRIIDIQRQFLLKMEMTARKPPEEQSWKMHFEAWSSKSSLYASFITSEKGAKESIMAILADGRRFYNEDFPSVLRDSIVLLSLPSQRLPKYSGFLQELRQQGDLSESQLSDVSASIQALQEALRDIHAAFRDKELLEARVDLVARVQDWKNHDIKYFSKLLLFDIGDVFIGRSEIVKSYHIYLFEHIILCCREVSLGRKPAPKPARKWVFRLAKNAQPDLGTCLDIRGRLFIKNVIEIIALSKPGSYTCQIWWKGDPGVESFSMKFATESKMKTWYQEIDRLRRLNAPVPERSQKTELPAFPQGRATPNPTPNPYKNDTEDEGMGNVDMGNADMDNTDMDNVDMNNSVPDGNWV